MHLRVNKRVHARLTRLYREQTIVEYDHRLFGAIMQFCLVRLQVVVNEVEGYVWSAQREVDDNDDDEHPSDCSVQANTEALV